MGLLVKIPELSWPIIDGSPKNPAAFEALYRACNTGALLWNAGGILKEYGKDSNSQHIIDFGTSLQQLHSRMEKAIALADKE